MAKHVGYFSETESGCFCRQAINYYGTSDEILTHAAAPNFKKSSNEWRMEMEMEMENTPELVAIQFNQRWLNLAFLFFNHITCRFS